MLRFGSSTSIITPCYNGSKYLRETLESALNQTHPPLEIIVIDDGSTDDSAAIAESFGSPVHVIRQANQGESVARNRGIEMARGSHLLFLDADDLLHPEALERMAEAAADQPEVVVRMGCVWFEEEPLRPFQERAAVESALLPAIIRGNLGPPHSWLLPKAIIPSVNGFRTDLQIYEDWEFWCRVALTGAELRNVDFVGAYYRRHPQSQLGQMGGKSTAKTALGHIHVMETLVQGLLEQPDRLVECGDALFWQCWTAMHNGRRMGIPWSEMNELRTGLEWLIKKGPAEVRETRFAKLARLVGVKYAQKLQGLFSPAALANQS